MGDLELNRRDIVLVLTPMLHRDPQVWERPDVFDPDRFAPGRREHIPAHAWLPFGNGERSCIGRAFALQEAALVLAMMLQRFDISRPGLYALRIKETLTLKPEGLTIRARQRRAVTRTLGGRPAAAMAGGAAQPPAAMASHGTPLLALYGSNSGASEAFARRIASDGEARGYAVRVAPMDEYAGRLPRGGAVVIVTASYNGQPPDNARAFMTWLAGMPQASLSGLRHAVFGCGNKDWFATYQEIPKRVAELLHAAGSGAFMERGEADGREDFFGDFERWYQPFWDRLGEALGVAAQTVGTEPLYRVEVLPPSAIRLIEQNQLEMATIVDNVELVDLGSPFGRSKRHIVLDLPPGTSYAAGDYLALLPQNHPEVVERAARRFAVRPDAAILLRSNRGAMAASLPTERPVSVRELLGGHVELSTPARQIDVASIASRLACPPHREALAAIAQDGQRYRAEILDKRVSVLDLLETYPDCDLSLAEFLEMLPAMRVRQYSISSSPRMGPTRCSLTVAVVSAPAWSGHGQYHGICSTWLARLKPGDSVPVAIRTPNAPFHPPASNATPIVMIAAGTGIAPFRGFIEERAARKAAGERTGPALLFFGCDHPDVDFLYHEELERWASEGVVEVLPAFYHQPDGEIRFVQHRLWRERERVKAAFLDGTVFFLCGDGKAMAPAVRRTLERIYQEVSGCGDEEAAVWLHEMEAQGRYVPDVFA